MTTTTSPQGVPAPTRTPVFVSHVAPLQRDVTYDHRAAQAALPVKVHFRDGTTADALLVLDPDQLATVSIQLEQAIDTRARAHAREQ